MIRPIDGFPWWMNTRWGRWLCTRWRPAAKSWIKVMALHIHKEEKATLERCTVDFQRAANACVVRDFSDDSRRELTKAWCAWRNARYSERRSLAAVGGRDVWREDLEDPAWSLGEQK